MARQWYLSNSKPKPRKSKGKALPRKGEKQNAAQLYL